MFQVFPAVNKEVSELCQGLITSEINASRDTILFINLQLHLHMNARMISDYSSTKIWSSI